MANPSVSIPDPLLADADAIAHARSAPGDKYHRSQVICNALELYVEDNQDEVVEGNSDSSDLHGEAEA